jgi:hypothetical protein
MTSKDTKRKLIKENKYRLKDPHILDVRRTVSTKSPSSDLKCPMQIIIFLGQDDCFYLSTISCLNHCHHPALKADAILRGQNDVAIQFRVHLQLSIGHSLHKEIMIVAFELILALLPWIDAEQWMKML